MQRIDGTTGEHKQQEKTTLSAQQQPGMPLSTDEPEPALPLNVKNTRKSDASAPSFLVIDPAAEGYDAKAHKEYLEKFIPDYSGQRQIELINTRETVLRKMLFRKEWKKTAKYVDQAAIIKSWSDDISVVFHSLMGGALADQARKNTISMEFTILLEIYILLNLVKSLGQSATRSYLNYAGVTRMLKEELNNKDIVKTKDFELLQDSWSVWFEQKLHLAFIGLAATGIAFTSIDGGFNQALVLMGCGVLAEVFSSICHKKSQIRLAEEIKQGDVELGKVYRSRAYERVEEAGKYILGAGAALSLADIAYISTTDNPAMNKLTIASFFVVVAGFIGVGALAPRMQGSDIVNHIIDELKLGDGTKRLEALFLNCMPSRSDRDDFFSATMLTVLLGAVGVALSRDGQIGYLAAAACVLAGYYTLKSQVHLRTLSLANEVNFWRSANKRADIEAPHLAPVSGESKTAVQTLEEKQKQREKDDCISGATSCLSKTNKDFYRWFTKASDKGWCSSAAAPIQNQDGKRVRKG